MAVSESKSKTRLYQVAKEFNLSHDTLIEFLIKKGFNVKNHMSAVDEIMFEAVERQYRKDRVEAERHAIKRKEFDEQDRKRRGDEKPKEAKPKKKDGDEPAEAPQMEGVAEFVSEEPETGAEIIEAPAIGIAAEEGLDEPVVAVETEVTAAVEPDSRIAGETPVPPAETIVREAVEGAPAEQAVPAAAGDEAVAKAEPAAAGKAQDVPVTIPGDTPKEAADKSAEAVKAESEAGIAKEKAHAKAKADAGKAEKNVTIASSMPKMGLTVMGKMELEPKRKKPKPVAGEPAKPAEGESKDEKPHKKKKKKRIVAVKQEVTPDKTETDASKRRKKKKGTKREVDEAEVNEAIRRTIASMGDFGSSGRAVGKKRKRARRHEEELRQIERTEKAKSTINVYEYATVSELALLMHTDVASVISSLIGLGVMASINQRLDLETIELVAAEFGFDVEQEEEFETGAIEELEDDPSLMKPRPPIVTIMGHVDHGKTSLLDYIRSANVVAGESGGITQHIGAYTVTLDSGRKITFLDTPGHEAFTAMRARGAQATDIVVLVVSADDNVMPQTVEAISHAQAARVPIVIAINKIDKPDANPERIKQQLAERNILVEDWSGKYGSVEISAKKGLHIDALLERILLEADILELKSNYERQARGVVIEAQLDKGKGVVATILVQKGTLRVGDAFVAGTEFGRVRAMLDERDNRVDEAPPSTPVQVLGFDGLPQAGDSFVAVENDREAREVASVRQQIKRESDFRSVRRKTLDDISEQIKIGGVQDLALIVKGDVDGSVEALSDSLMKLSNEEVRIHVIHKGVGAISESDVLLAAASSAIIIGFHVRPNMAARKLAENEEVDIRLYEIIYDAINDVKSALEGLLRPEVSEKILASVGVREVFKISKVGTIAGCMVLEGKIHRNNRIRLVRDGIVVFAGAIDSLKRFKDDAREVDTGFECGISLLGFNDIKVGDIIEAYEIVETKRQLA